MFRRAMAGTVLAVAVVACGQGLPTVTPAGPAGEPVVVEGRGDGFALSMRVGSNAVDAGGPIHVAAQLVWEGAEPGASIWGSGSGPVTFLLEQLDGDIALGGVMTADCGKHDFVRNVPLQVPYRKSGGFSAEDPNADFYRAFFADPVLRLPAGTWRITATAGGYLAPCDMNAPTLDLSVATDILVR
jgi:hypothetical protein